MGQGLEIVVGHMVLGYWVLTIPSPDLKLAFPGQKRCVLLSQLFASKGPDVSPMMQRLHCEYLRNIISFLGKA